MTEDTFEQLAELHQSEGAAAAIDRLIETLTAQREYHRLFDALMLRKKFEMGLPLVQPTSFDDVPANQQVEFEESYIEAARAAGAQLLQAGKIPEAWVYFRTIREPGPVREALEGLGADLEPGEQTEQLIQVALYEGANPVKGLELLLDTHGTCSTITALDQVAQQLSADDRTRASALLVRQLYDDLTRTVRQEIQQKRAVAPDGVSLRELIGGCDWLFEDANYHIDVSHLNSIVRFARFLEPGSAELAMAIELAEYGSRLEPQLQYPGDPPFDDFYRAHLHFFRALAGEDRERNLAYFREKLHSETNDEEKPLLAYVLVDLLTRCDRLDDALAVARQHLADLAPTSGFSFAQLCQRAGRMTVLREIAQKKGDLVGYTAALVQEGSEAVSA